MAVGSSALAAALSVLGFLMISFCYSLPTADHNYTFVKEATDSSLITYHDYIIVGGGTSGCPLAATLSQSGSSVLLLERGGSPYGNRNISNLARFAATLGDDSPGSASQRFVSEDGVINSRARVLGGGSCLNAGFYSRAAPDYVRAAGWDPALVHESYSWVERTVAFEPPVRQWQSAVRDGLVEVGITPYNGFTYDHLYGTKIGGSIFDKDGHRHTAADLLADARAEHLTVLLHATALKLLFRFNKGSSRPVAHGVMYKDARGVLHRAYLNDGPKNEIILAAGAMGSPQVLMLSGVGPRRHLESLGIKVVLDQPLIGQGMSDNPMNAIFIPSPVPIETSLIEVVGITHFGSYIEAASGALLSVPDEIEPQSRKFGVFSPQNGELYPAVQAAGDPNDTSLQAGFILEKIMGPLSTGELLLKNQNPDDNPKVTFNYFKEPEDLRRCVEGVNTIKKVIKSKAFSKFRYPYISIEALINMTAMYPMNLRPKHDNLSKSTEQFCKDTVMTIWHYHGGCQSGRVVDGNYRVTGIDALRVIDGSTFHASPGTNPQATVMMLGRYMGVKIQQERLQNKS